MKITNISVSAWSTGSFQIMLEGDTFVTVNMTEDESERFRQLASDIFFARQKAIAREIETARPLLIELQPEATEPAPRVDDDIHF